jgi:aerotaxis receptor
MSKPTPTDEAYTFSDGLIVSSTDLNGNITYGNRKFCTVSGYSKSELIGKNHNIIRHPDMPKIAFRQLWNTIKDGNEWTGIVKNLRKDGLYYWVYTHITPVIKDGKLVGYSAARRPATKNEILEITPIYKDLKEKENN